MKAPAVETTKAPRAGGRFGSVLLLAGLAGGALVTLATATAVLAGILLAPGLLALAIDPAPGRPTARAVVLFGLAATVQPLATLWRTGHHVAAALDMAADLTTLATAWVAQGGAWILCELTPLVIAFAMEAVSRTRAARLRTTRTGYEQQWGMPPERQESGER